MIKVPIGDIALHVLDRGRGPALLLVHGFPLDHTMWREQVDDLAQTFRVIAPDLRGFGRSDVSTGTVSMRQMADDLAMLLDALGLREPITLCGLSMGGYVAWQFWRRYADRLERLILCDTRADKDTEEMARGRLETAERVLAEGPAVVAEGMLPKLFADVTVKTQPALVEDMRRVMLATAREGIAAALRGMALRDDMTAVLGQVNTPTLVICGQHDAISRVEEMRDIARQLPQAEFVEIPDAGHMAPLEKPELVNAAIRRFLQP